MPDNPTKLYPAQMHQDLPFGPTTEVSFEQQVSIPVDGSNKDGRAYSPFTLRLLVPDIYAGADPYDPQSRAFLRGLETLAGGLADNLSYLSNLIPEGQSLVATPQTGGDLTDSFSVADFALPGSTEVPAEYHPNLQALSVELEKVQFVLSQLAQRPIQLTVIPGGGWRTLEYNRDVLHNDTDQSLHLFGKAADVRDESGTFSPEDLYFIIQDLRASGEITNGGLGLYPKFVHYDIRGYTSNWNPRPEDGSLPELLAEFDSPLPNAAEILRLQGEAGVTGPSQSRTWDEPFLPSDIDLIDVAAEANDAFTMSKKAQERLLLQESSAYFGGRGRDFVRINEFISGGEWFEGPGEEPKRPRITDLQTAVDIASQIQQILRVPPLTLLVNPTSVSVTFTGIQQFTERSRYGYIFQAWGEEQPKLSISGVTGAWIAGSPPNTFVREGGDTQVPTGVQWASKRDSAAFQNLMSLFTFYQNNGYIYDTINKSNAHHAVGSISIEYDGWIYVGNFESLNYSYTEEKPHGLVSFSMEFSVNYLYDTDRTSQALPRPMNAPSPSDSDPKWVIPGGATPTSRVDEVPEQNDGLPEEFSQGGELTGTGLGDSPPDAGASTEVPANSGGMEDVTEAQPTGEDFLRVEELMLERQGQLSAADYTALESELGLSREQIDQLVEAVYWEWGGDDYETAPGSI